MFNNKRGRQKGFVEKDLAGTFCLHEIQLLA
jgi:hypothetical protein